MSRNERTALRSRLVISKKNGETREGRGFSREELRKAGISPNQALRLGLPVDARRRTVHEENVELAKQQLPSSEPVKKRAKKEKEAS